MSVRCWMWGHVWETTDEKELNISELGCYTVVEECCARCGQTRTRTKARVNAMPLIKQGVNHAKEAIQADRVHSRS